MDNPAGGTHRRWSWTVRVRGPNAGAIGKYKYKVNVRSLRSGTLLCPDRRPALPISMRLEYRADENWSPAFLRELCELRAIIPELLKGFLKKVSRSLQPERFRLQILLAFEQQRDFFSTGTPP